MRQPPRDGTWIARRACGPGLAGGAILAGGAVLARRADRPSWTLPAMRGTSPRFPYALTRVLITVLKTCSARIL